METGGGAKVNGSAEQWRGRIRDPGRSRKATLDAAEALFAEKGFEAASIQEIAQKAGVSRGTPNYLFGSKEGLYRAVLGRAFEAPRELIASVGAREVTSEAEAEEALRAAIVGYLEFLVDNPGFVRLIQWETLEGGRYLGDLPAHLRAFREALDELGRVLGRGRGGFDRDEAAQVFVSIVALCWFPLAYEDTFLRPLGLEARDPRFLAERKRHVIDLIVGGFVGRGSSTERHERPDRGDGER
jgi:AcrR family transcriptional regulator